MKNSAFENFSEDAQNVLDYARCQRSDGSFYGTGGQCRKGSPAGAKEKTATRTRPKAAIESDMKKLSSSGAMAAKGMAGVRAREEHAALKAELKKPLAGARSSAKTSGEVAKKSAASDLKAKRAEVRELDKQAKAADKAADKADKKFQKSKSPADQKEAKRLDKVWQAADKEANKGQKELERMARSAQADKGRESNVKLGRAIQDGPASTPKQRASAMRYLRQERNRLEAIEDDKGLSKVGQARLKLVKASQREYEIQGKQNVKAQTK